MADTSHLVALMEGLGRERQRHATAKTAAERELRAVWIAQAEREIAAEEAFLGMGCTPVDLTDDELLAELLG
jgi:hypothetical protein